MRIFAESGRNDQERMGCLQRQEEPSVRIGTQYACTIVTQPLNSTLVVLTSTRVLDSERYCDRLAQVHI